MTTATHTFKVGDLVTPNPEYDTRRVGMAYRVTKVNPKNILAEPVELYAGARPINYPAYALLPFDPDAPRQPAARPLLLDNPMLAQGTVVTLTRPYRDYTTTTPCVVIADKGARVNVVRLGNTGTAYLRIPRAGLVVRDVEWLRGALAAAEASA